MGHFFAFSAFTLNTLSTFSRLYLHIFLCNRVLLHCGISTFTELKGLEFEEKKIQIENRIIWMSFLPWNFCIKLTHFSDAERHTARCPFSLPCPVQEKWRTDSEIKLWWVSSSLRIFSAMSDDVRALFTCCSPTL